GTGIPEPPLPLTWVDLALSGSAQLFANAIHYQDRCFDVADEADYAGIVASIMALAGEAWPDATVSATKVMRHGPHGLSARMEIAIDGQGSSAPFDLIVAKDFDWSVSTSDCPRGQQAGSRHSSTAMPSSSTSRPIRSRLWASCSGTTSFPRSNRRRNDCLRKPNLRPRMLSLLNRRSGQWSSACRSVSLQESG